jgi:hypothetical protein
MRKATTLLATLLLIWSAGTALAQQNEYNLSFPTSEDITAPFTQGVQSGSRGVSGPWDLDGDGKAEVLVTDYTGGGRVHVVEAQGPNDWQHVYSTPWMDSTASVNNARYAAGGDLDGDGSQEIIFIAGNSYSAFNPNPDLVVGLYVFEHTGDDNDFGTLPASINTLDDIDIGAPASGYSEFIQTMDIDGDGTQEVLFAFNGPSSHDLFYIYSVSGTYEPNGLGQGFEVWAQEFRIGPRENGNFFGGGSAILMEPADLDGDGTPELSLHAWNSFNFFNVDVTGPDTYVVADSTVSDRFLQASPWDNPSLVQAAVVDINQDGDDEVFYPIFDFATPAENVNINVSVLNYEDGEDIFSVTTDNLIYDFMGPLTELGLTSGDLDGDDNLELLGTGEFGYSAARYNDGEPSRFIQIAEFTGGVGGDPEDPSNYAIHEVDTSIPEDTLGFNTIVQVDSLGVMSEFFETAGGGIFAVKIANLGDADNDGNTEIALALQGTDDSLSVIDRVWNADSSRFDNTIRSTTAVTNRIFMRIVEFPGTFTVNTEDLDGSGIPSGFTLSPNYPNPFNPSTSFTFTLPVDAAISVKIYDITGRLVTTLVDHERYSAGMHQATWGGTNMAGMQVASGTYLYTLEYGTFRQSRTMLLIK